jgi:hypothetical protein
MATRAVFSPLAAEFPSANFPQLLLVNRRPVLAFDAASDEAARWTGIAPQGLTGTITVVITYVMASAVTGNVVFQAQLEAISDGDSFDLDAGDSFDTANSSGAVAVPGTAGYIDQISITMTNADSIAPGDYFRLSINRDADNASDTAAGDCYVLSVELRDGG